MVRIRLRLCVAIGALENCVVRDIRVTVRTYSISIAVRSREPRMIKRGPGPSGRRVTGLAGCRKSR